MPPPVSSLPDELVEEFLLHLPSDTPASLVRAGLVCKRWCRLISGAGFRRKFHEFHRSSPMLGFLYYQRDIAGDHVARFIPISASCPPAHHAGDDGSHCLYPSIGLVVPYLNFYTPGISYQCPSNL
nr:unnamed protein product [Digitaria exilis]